MAISLQELRVKFSLSQAQLDAEISDEDLTEVSSIIGDHELLGPVLGLTHEKFAWKASYCTLINALLKCIRADCAQKLCKLLAQGK